MEQHKILFGSKMLRLENNRDEDWLTFIDEDASTAREQGCKSIPFYKNIIKFFTKDKNIKPDIFSALYLYQLSVGFTDNASYPFSDFNIFEHTKVWKEWLKAYINSAPTEEWAGKNEILPKQFYHILYQYYMITEDTHFISDEAKAKVQKIHDLEVPASYFYELKEMINSLEIHN